MNPTVRKVKVLIAIQSIIDSFNKHQITKLEGAVALKVMLKTLKKEGIDIEAVSAEELQ